MTRIVYRRMFTRSCIVITSRPTASSSLHSLVDCRVEIVGFTEEDRLDYIQTALQGNDDKVKALTLYLQSNPTINALCYIPLNMTILLCLAEDGIDGLPKSQTDMYKKFIEMAILRFIKKIDVKCSQVIISITRLPNPYNIVFKELACLAYEALKIDKVVFKLNEIKEVCPNVAMAPSNWSGLGLLKAAQHANTEVGNVTFHFLHFSIQEYMAALYISTLSVNQQTKLLKETFWQHRYYNTWIMYVGITQGNSFALKHFLSGNRFQLSTWIFKSLSISRKFLENKIKCLHLFQCLVESNDEDLIASVSQFFQDNQIDLSHQTLLPSDVNTLGFFLMRSINKHWKLLNLSGCNIGSVGINILYDRFLRKESHNIVVIDKVNFSYNQLNFSSLIQLFNLSKSWHSSELLIKDNICQYHDRINLYEVVEETFWLTDYHKQLCAVIGPFLFGYKINKFPAHLKTRSMYLFNCTSVPTTVKNLREMHLINTPFPILSMQNLWCGLLNNITTLFVYDPELPYQDAEKIVSLVSVELVNRKILIINKNKIQGIINTSAISEHLTKLEMLNLAVNVNRKCSGHMQTYPWKYNLHYDSSNSDLIVDTFIKLLQKITCNKWNWLLSIVLKENDVLIAHKVDYECIIGITKYHQLKAIYLSDCIIASKRYQFLFDTQSTLTNLCIFNGYIDYNGLTGLNRNIKEVFIHTLYDINIEERSCYFREDCSMVLVTNEKMLMCDPTTEQIALALQLKPSVNVLKLLHCQRNFDCFNQIIAMLTIIQNYWTKLDFMDCKLGEIEYEVLQNHLRVKNHSTVKNLKISSKQLTKVLVPRFIESILMWQVHHLILHDITHTVYEYFIAKFTTTITTVLEEVFISITCNRIADIYICNYSWNQITRLLKDKSLFLENCFPLQAENLNIKLSHISKLHMINITENTTVNILETFMEKKLTISIYNSSMNVDDNVLYNFITSKKFFCQSKVNFIALMKNLICGYNTTKDQLHLLQSQKLNNLEHAVVNLVSETKEMHEKELFVFQNDQLTALYYSGKTSKARFVTKLFTMLKTISTLKCFGIADCIINGKTADDVATVLSNNKDLEELYLNSKMLTTDLLKVVKVFVKLVNLKVLEMVKVTDQVAEYLTSVISHTHLQYFSITNGNLCTVNVIKISEALQNICNLQELTIAGNNTEATNIMSVIMSNNDGNMQSMCEKICINGDINEEEADDIAVVIYSNTHLQEFKYNLQTTDSAKITKVLQNISTLIQFHFSGYNIRDEAVDDIAAAICSNVQLQECEVSNCNLQSTGAIKIAKALQNTTLTKLCINDNHITDKAADDIAAAVAYNTKLQELDISNNILKATGAIKIAKALQNISTLKKLYINDNHITDEAADDIAAAICNNTQLQQLNISSNEFQMVGVVIILKALQGIFTFKKICISNSNITDKAADDIATIIYNNIHLQEFDVCKNKLFSTGAIKIAKALQNIFTLTKLYVNNNCITDEATDDLATALSCNTQLQVLDISNNYFQAAGILKVTNALHNIVTLTKLCVGKYINDYYNLSDTVARSIAVILHHNTELKELDIGVCKSSIISITGALHENTNLRVLRMKGNSNMKIFDEAIEGIAAVIWSNIKLQVIEISKTTWSNTKILKVLQHISSLTTLCISHNNLTDYAADDIATAISCNTQLKKLDISNNVFKATGAIKISKALQNISTLTKLYINDNHITDEAADDIAAALIYNSQLQKLNISSNYFQVVGTITILNALKDIFTLRKLYISNNGITDGAADDIAAVICCNTQLQELDVSDSDLQSTGVIKIVKALQNHSALTKLYINDNSITDEAADEITAVLSCTVVSKNTFLRFYDY